ncbi:hypothetical protein BEL04_14185 [Mucilaginibacter sp. PPCGB 2223]|uniref:DUF2911 domain-containing protein n=1 Tax=Mucilaginibacter sp. PPCGB 2223 TaxID=1886027 RepID=UPI0008250208|nr:DUF2911 domain-containing protein [Mucilaginibacter sp. PPCGB 2223]OCX52594.1 hypothetical protein BEL04_14185 [Mucilaginibacter sp. PPCGB 2223]
MRITLFSLTLLTTIGCFTASAQQQDLKIPQPSTLQKIEQDFGLGTISIAYSRPNALGRKVFNGMEPYGIVWRTGANSATVIKFTDTVTMAGHQVLPGTYGFFTIPGKDEWTIILNKVAKQWGAYSYDAKQDVLRFTVKPAKLDKPTETFTMMFSNTTPEYTNLHLMWETTDVVIPFVTDVDARVMGNIALAMKGQNKPYYFAAIYYHNHNKDMNTALEWINEADKASPDAYNIKYWKARILLKKGDTQAAAASASEGLKLAEKEANPEYIRLNKEVLAQAAKK